MLSARPSLSNEKPHRYSLTYQKRGWRGDPRVKSACCSWRWPQFSPSTCQLAALCHPRCRALNALFWFLRGPSIFGGAGTYVPANTHTHTFFFFNKKSKGMEKDKLLVIILPLPPKKSAEAAFTSDDLRIEIRQFGTAKKGIA